jgi:23S rRNA pseudouridine1911/1915/1917 synthase
MPQPSDAHAQNTTRSFTADRGDHGSRLDLVLRRHLGDIARATRTRLQSAIADGLVSVDGQVARKTSLRVMLNQQIAIDMLGFTPRRVVGAEERPLEVLFEDEHLLAIDKPAGIVVHPTYAHGEGTLMNALLWHARTWRPGERPSIVGRLDKLTSGIVLVAKTRAVHAALQRALASARAEKEYVALVFGRVTPARGRIDKPLARDPRDRRRVVVRADGAPSITLYETMAHSRVENVPLTLLRCRILTGRMHQIRVHLTSRGWCVVGDPKYADPHRREIANAVCADAVRNLRGQALHAYRLAFVHPVTGTPIDLRAPLHEDVAALLGAANLPAADLGLQVSPAADLGVSGQFARD